MQTTVEILPQGEWAGQEAKMFTHETSERTKKVESRSMNFQFILFDSFEMGGSRYFVGQKSFAKYRYFNGLLLIVNKLNKKIQYMIFKLY